MPSISSLQAFNLQRWIEEHKDKLKPPVGNAQVWELPVERKHLWGR